MIDAHHIPIPGTVLVTLDAAVRSAFGHDAAAEIRSRLHFDLGCVRQAFGGMGIDCGEPLNWITLFNYFEDVIFEYV